MINKKVLTNNEIIKALAVKTGFTNTQIKNVLDKFNTFAVEQVKKNGEFKVAGLGKIKLSHRAAREVRNPQNGKMIKVPAKNVVKFSFSKSTKELVK